MIALLRFTDKYGKARFFSLGMKPGSFGVLGIPDDKSLKQIISGCDVEIYSGINDDSGASKIISSALAVLGAPENSDLETKSKLLSSGKIAVELTTRMGSRTLSSLFPSEGFAVLRGTNITGFNKSFGPFFDDKSVSYSARGPDSIFARAEVNKFLKAFYIPETIFREFSFENLRIERTFAGDARNYERYFVFFGNPGRGVKKGPKSARSLPPLAFEQGPFHKDFPLKIEDASGKLVRMGVQGEFICGDFDPKGAEYRADDLSLGIHSLRISSGAKLRYFFHNFLDNEVNQGRLSDARRANSRKFIRALRASTGRTVYGTAPMGFEYTMRKTITDDPDKDRKNVARAMAALFRVPLLICAMASAKNGGLELAIKSVDSYGIMLIEKLTTLGIPKDSSVAVVNKYLGMAKQYAELMVVFCDINRTKLMSVETVEQYFRIIADGLEIKIPEVPELANKKFAEVMSIYTYSDEYYLIRNEIRNTQFIPADSIDEFNENV